MTKKIILLALCSLLFAPCSAVEAQQTGKVPRIGFLDSSTASGMVGLLEAFLQELSKLGWIEGKNFTIEYRFAENKGSERVSELAAELVPENFKIDVALIAQGRFSEGR